MIENNKFNNKQINLINRISEILKNSNERVQANISEKYETLENIKKADNIKPNCDLTPYFIPGDYEVKIIEIKYPVIKIVANEKRMIIVNLEKLTINNDNLIEEIIDNDLNYWDYEALKVNNEICEILKEKSSFFKKINLNKNIIKMENILNIKRKNLIKGW